VHLHSANMTHRDVKTQVMAAQEAGYFLFLVLLLSA
jgi:hypothetical protein